MNTWTADELLAFKEFSFSLFYLFVGKDEQYSISQLILRQHPRQLLPRLIHSLPIVTVHNKNQTCGNNSDRLKYALKSCSIPGFLCVLVLHDTPVLR